MSILFVDLEKEEIKKLTDRDLKGYRLAHFLMENKNDRIVFLSLSKDSLSISGACSTVYAFFSERKGKIDYGFFPSDLSLILYSLGFSALVIEGKAEELSYLSIRAEKIEIIKCLAFKFSSYSRFSAAVKKRDDDLVLSTSKAADELIAISALYEDNLEVGHTGFGYAFASLNLKGICLERIKTERTECEENKRFLKLLEESKLASKLKRDSSASFVKNAERLGFLPIENFTRRHDGRIIFLDGSYLKEKDGAYSAVCSDCPLSCKRVLQDGQNAPDVIDMMAFGSLQGFFSSEKVMILKEEAINKGLSRIEAGAMILNYDSLDDKLKALREYSGKDYKSYKAGNVSILYDPRGSGLAALFYILGDQEIPYGALYLDRRISDRSSAILALYERLYRYALSSRALPVLPSYVSYVSNLPKWIYSFPSILRYALSHVRFFNIDANELLKEGLEIINLVGDEDNELDDHFLYTSSSNEDVSVVNQAMLKDYYKREKGMLEAKLLKR